MKRLNFLHLYYLDPSKRADVVSKMNAAGFDVFFSPVDIPPENVHAMLVGADELQADKLQSYSGLKVIQVLGDSTALIDTEYCEQAGIKLLTTQGPRGHLIAEHAIGLALSLLRRFRVADQAVRNGDNPAGHDTVETKEAQGCDNWPEIEPQTLFCSTVGILGAGSIGLEIAQRLRPFGCEINYYKRTTYSESTEKKLGISSLPFEQILVTSDVLFVQLPLNKSTRSLINSDNISLLKRGVIVINCGRAAVLEEVAFMSALSSRRIAYAGLDVFWHEPLPVEHPLCSNDRVLLTPHMAEVGGREVHLLRQEALDQIIDSIGQRKIS